MRLLLLALLLVSLAACGSSSAAKTSSCGLRTELKPVFFTTGNLLLLGQAFTPAEMHVNVGALAKRLSKAEQSNSGNATLNASLRQAWHQAETMALDRQRHYTGQQLASIRAKGNRALSTAKQSVCAD